jgi:hypothetical protein
VSGEVVIQNNPALTSLGALIVNVGDCVQP